MNLSLLRRLLQLVSLLQGGRQHNAEALARECEVSRRIAATHAARMLASYAEFAAAAIPLPQRDS